MISSFVLISLISLMIFGSIYKGVETTNDFKEYYFVNDYLYKQSLALKNTEHLDIDYGLYFNELAHVNMAKTIKINNKDLVVNLGNGRIHFE